MSKAYFDFEKQLLTRVRQNAKSTNTEEKYLSRKFKYFDNSGDGLCNYNDFSKVMARLNINFISKTEEYDVFNEIILEQKGNGVSGLNMKNINYTKYIQTILGIQETPKSNINRNNEKSYKVNQTSSEMMPLNGQRLAPGQVSKTQYEDSVSLVSQGICSVNLLYVLTHINSEIKGNAGHKKIKYVDLLNCFIKLGLGFKYEVWSFFMLFF